MATPNQPYSLSSLGDTLGNLGTGVKNAAISLFAPSATAPGDYTSRSAEIARQQKLADMLTQMGAQDIPVSTAGGITAPISPWAALAKGLQSGAGSYMSAKAARDAAGLTAADRANAMDLYKQAMGSPEVALGQGISQGAPTTGKYTLPLQMPDVGAGKGPVENVDIGMPAPGRFANTVTPAVAPLSMADRNALGIKSILGGAGPTTQKLAELFMQKPETRNLSEYGSETTDPLTGKVLSSTPSNAKIPVPGHMTVGNRIRAINPDGTPGADLGPAPTGNGTKVDITIPQGPDATAVREANAAATTNRNMEANYALMIDMLPNIPTGKTVPVEMAIKGALQSLGISPKTIELGTQETFRALSNQAALYLRNPASGMGLTGNTSDRDITFLKEGGPGIAQSQFANEAVLLIARAKSRRNAELAELEMDHLTTQGNYKGWAKVKKDYINSTPFFNTDEQARWNQFTPKRAQTPGAQQAPANPGGAAAPGGATPAPSKPIRFEDMN